MNTYPLILSIGQPRAVNLNMLACLLQSCPTLCNPMDCNPTGSSVYGTLQARIQEWVAVPPCRGSSQPRDLIQVSYVSCIAGRFFTNQTATWEVPHGKLNLSIFLPIGKKKIKNCISYKLFKCQVSHPLLLLK